MSEENEVKQLREELARLEKANQALKGEAFAPYPEVWDEKAAEFAGAFEKVRRSSIPEWYRFHVGGVQGSAALDPHLSETNSSYSAPERKEPKLDLVGEEGAEDAHLIPDSSICSATYGIIAQAVVGCDLEGLFEDRNDKIKALQQLVNGQSGKRETNERTGLKYSPLNFIRVHGKHQVYFDESPTVAIIPILSLDDAKNKWKPGEEYWVLVVAADSGKYHKVLGRKAEYVEGRREKASPKDLETATQLLAAMTKANAEVLYGRDGEALTPMALFDKKNDTNIEQRKQMLRETLRTLGNKKVKVPVLKRGGAGCELMKVKLDANLATVPDPMLLVQKAVINWSSFCGNKLLPVCSDGPEIDPDEAELYDMAAEQYQAWFANSIRPSTPMRLAAGLKGSPFPK